MNIVIGHIVLMVVFFLGALFATLTPVLLSRRQEHNTIPHGRCQSIIVICNSIGGGVLLATCFIALVPLVEHSYFKAISAVNIMQTDRPFAEITILAGFFLVIFIELLVTVVQKKNGGSDNGAADSPEEESLFSDMEESSHHHNHSHGPGHSHSHMVDGKSILRSVILVITLGLHTLFEGMAIGLVSEVDTLITLAIAVMLHELCCAVALGLNLSQQKITKTTAIAVCVSFSFMMPLGIAFGLAMGQVTGVAGLLLTAILQGVATGTFIYVLFIEIVPNIISDTNAALQMVLMLAGCIFMTLLIVFTDPRDEQFTVVSACSNTTAYNNIH